MSDLKDFVIENGVLSEYHGAGGDVVIPEGVTTIGYCAFSECHALTSVSLPESLIKIDPCAFMQCASLSAIVFPKGLRRIENAAFSDCTALTELFFPDELQFVGYNAFSCCSSLVSVSIPYTKISIGNAFDYCSALTTIIIRSVDAEVKADAFYVDNGAFAVCEGVEKIISCSAPAFSAVWKTLDKERRMHMLAEAIRTNDIEENLASKIAANQKQLIQYAINANDLQLLMNLLSCSKKITLTILDKAIELAETLPELSAFLLDYKQKQYPPKKQEKMETVAVEKELGLIEKSAADWKKIFTTEKSEDDDGIAIKSYKGTDCYIEIPKMIGKAKVTAILSDAFSPTAERLSADRIEVRNKIVSVVIPEGIILLESFSFGFCNALTSITIPNSVTEIEKYAFTNCPNLTIHAPAGSYAEQYAKENNIPFVAE